MNKELEESKRTIKDYIHDWIGNSTDEDGYTKYEIGEEEQKFFEAIETVLQALENSIPKEVIEKKIEELNENGYWDFIEERDYEEAINILKKLLEEK